MQDLDRGPARPRLAARRAARRGRVRGGSATSTSRGAGSSRARASSGTRPACPASRRTTVGMAASLRRQVLVAGRSKSPLLATRSLGRRYDVARPRPRGRPRRGPRARRDHQRRLRHRRRRRARAVPRPARPAGRRAAHGDGGEHPRRARRQPRATSSCRRGSSCPSRRRSRRERFDRVHDEDHQRAPRARARRRPTRSPGSRPALPTSLIVGAAAQPDRSRSTSRRRTCAAARSTSTSAARAIEAQLPDGAAQRVRGQRDRALVLRRPVPRHPLRPGRGHRSRTRSSSASASRSTRCSPPASDAALGVVRAGGARGRRATPRRATPRARGRARPGGRSAPRPSTT